MINHMFCPVGETKLNTSCPNFVNGTTIVIAMAKITNPVIATGGLTALQNGFFVLIE